MPDVQENHLSGEPTNQDLRRVADMPHWATSLSRSIRLQVVHLFLQKLGLVEWLAEAIGC